MKTTFAPCIAFALAVFAAAGCNLSTLSAFRAQMRDTQEFLAWEDNDHGTLVFKQPLLTIADLEAMEIIPEMVDEQVGVLRYRRLNAPAGLAVEYEVRMLFSEAKLAGIVLPPSLRDGLGRQNIIRLLAMIGGVTGRGGMLAIPKTQLASAGLLPMTADSMPREAEVSLAPVDPRNRPIYIKCTETKKPGYYSEFLISVRRT